MCVLATQSAVANAILVWICTKCFPHVLSFQGHEVLHERSIEMDLVDHQPVVNTTNLASWSAMHAAPRNSDIPHSPELKNNWATPSRVTMLVIHEAAGVATEQRVWQCGHTPAPSPRFATNGMCTVANDECLVAHDLESSAPLRAMKHRWSVIVVMNLALGHVQCQRHREPFIPYQPESVLVIAESRGLPMGWMCRVHGRTQPMVGSRKRLAAHMALALDKVFPRERHRAPNRRARRKVPSVRQKWFGPKRLRIAK